jgi:aminopeptidase N
MAALLLVLLGFVSPVFADDYPRQLGVDVRGYVFQITLRDDVDEIAGQATIDVLFVRPGVRSLALDLASPTRGRGMRVSSVTCGNAPVPFTHEAGRLTIATEPPPPAGERRSFTVRYSGVPAGGLRIGSNRHGERVFFTVNWPDQARQWLPAIDHPYDKAAVEFIVDAPASYRVVANGALVGERASGGGRRVTHWREAAPIATWLAAIGVARFDRRRVGSAEGVPLETWTFRKDRGRGAAAFDRTARRAMKFFEERIGPYSYEKLANVEAWGFDGGMENASAIFYSDRTLAARLTPAMVAHEVAHQWFGDSVTESDWDDVWLSEGFATYFELLFIERYEGRAAFLNALRRSRDVLFDAQAKQPSAAVVDHRPWKGIPSQVVYQKGAWTLRMLRGLLGADRFAAGIREYYRLHRDANASTADFRRAMEVASGMDLGWFFDQWLYRPGAPVLEAGWAYDKTRKKVVVEISQAQLGPPYRLSAEVALAAKRGAKPAIHKIEIAEKRQRFELPALHSPASIVFDPQLWVLADVRWRKGPSAPPRSAAGL